MVSVAYLSTELVFWTFRFRVVFLCMFTKKTKYVEFLEKKVSVIAMGTEPGDVIENWSPYSCETGAMVSRVLSVCKARKCNIHKKIVDCSNYGKVLPIKVCAKAWKKSLYCKRPNPGHCWFDSSRSGSCRVGERRKNHHPLMHETLQFSGVCICKKPDVWWGGKREWSVALSYVYFKCEHINERLPNLSVGRVRENHVSDNTSCNKLLNGKEKVVWFMLDMCCKCMLIRNEIAKETDMKGVSKWIKIGSV